MAVMSQNIIPVHIAFIPLLIPPLLAVMDRLRLDRRAIACALTFGLVTTYMFLPLGFGKIFLEDILLGNISAGLDTSGINVMAAMGIPALGMVAGLLIALFVTYRRPRDHAPRTGNDEDSLVEVSRPKIIVAVAAIVVSFAVQTWLTVSGSKADSLLVGALVGLFIFVATGTVRVLEADEVFTAGMR